MFSAFANASYLNDAASTVVSTVQGDAVTVLGWGWALMGVIFGGMLVMKLVKRVTRGSL